MKMKKIAVIHTTSATINSIQSLIKEKMGDAEVINFLDDSILKDMIAGKNYDLVEKKWLTYAEFAKESGAGAVLSACSTVGEIAELADRTLGIPVYRIDEAMAVKAIERGNKVAVFATLSSTLIPTKRLIERKAKKAHKNCTITQNLVEGAYERLMFGDKEGHDKAIADAVLKVIDSTDVVVLAQASMASALSAMNKEQMSKVLTSPELGIELLAERMR
jgi:aspartate/glutamate racemase